MKIGGHWVWEYLYHISKYIDFEDDASFLYLLKKALKKHLEILSTNGTSY